MPKLRKPTRILFIGNSFTARNNLPQLLTDIAAVRGLELKAELINQGGASLKMHWNKGHAREAIEQGNFEYVVMQEQSTLPVKNAARMRENVLLFDPAIRAAKSKSVLYMTWARKHSPQSQKAITDAYESIGKEISAIVVPVGVVWEKFMKAHDKPELHDKDQSHPTLAGSYLAACVFARVLLDLDPRSAAADIAKAGGSIGKLTLDDAKLLESFASK